MTTHEEILAYANKHKSKLQGNWQKFESFYWRNRPEHKPENWTMIYTCTRDSSLAEILVSDKIHEEINKIEQADRHDSPTEFQYQEEDQNHFAYGWVKGFAIKVVDDVGEFTPAFLKYCECQIQVENGIFLDEDFVYEKMREGTIENIISEGKRYVSAEAPTTWANEVLDAWLAEDDNNSVFGEDGNPAWLDSEKIKDLLYDID